MGVVMKGWRGGLAAVGWLLLVPTAAAAASESRVEPSMAECVADAAGRVDFSGVVSLIRSGQAVTYARGSIEGAGSPAITLETRFNLGSVSKMFTAVAVAQLLDERKIRLDDPIGRSVKGLTVEASRVTVRQLLTHSSGLGDYFAPQNLPAMAQARTLTDLLPLVARERPEFTPGSRFAYSDSGFLLLGLLIERVSGESYGDYLRAHVFEPARMMSTSLDPGAAPNQAIGLTRMSGSLSGAPMGSNAPLLPAPEAALEGSSAGGVYGTAGDLQRFFAALANGELAKLDLVRMFTSTQIVGEPAREGRPELDYGFGFGVGHFAGRRWFGHNGGAPGVNAEAIVFPDDRVSMVVLANRDPPMASALFRGLRRAIFEPSPPGAVGAMSPGGCGSAPPSQADPRTTTSGSPTAPSASRRVSTSTNPDRSR